MAVNINIPKPIIDYNDLENKPTLVTEHSQLTLNDGTNPHGTTKADVGLNNVPNLDTTNAINKAHDPVTLDGAPNYLTIIGQAITRGLINLASHVTGRLPFSNLATGTARSVVGRSGSGNGDVGNISAGNDTILSRSGSGDVNFNSANTVKAILSLQNVDNTSDLSKPISTETQTALDLKADDASISLVGKSNNYDDLTNKPTIPSVAGANGEIQFNSGGVFGASSKLKFLNDTLIVEGLISSQGATKTQDAAENAIVDINNFVFSPRGTTFDKSNGLRIKGTINFDAANQLGRALFIDITSNATPSQAVRPIEINWAGNLTTISRIGNSNMEASSGNFLEIVRGQSGSTGQRLVLSGRSQNQFISKGIIFQDFELPNYWAVGTADASYLRFFHNSGSTAAGAVNPTMWLKDKRVGIGQYAAFNPQATLHLRGEGSTSATATQIWQNASQVELMRVSDNGTLKIGNFTTGAGVTNEALITTGIIRASGGLNLRTPTVGDNTFTGVRLLGSGLALVVSNNDVASFSNNGTVNSFTISTQRTYNAIASGSGDVANYNAFYAANHNIGSVDFGAYHTRPHITQTGTSNAKYYGYKCIPTIVSLTDSGNWRGLWLEANDGYNIYSAGTARNYIGGNVGIGTASPTSKLQVVGLPTYANNAAAITAGLTVGAMYIRTGHGLDIVV